MAKPHPLPPAAWIALVSPPEWRLLAASLTSERRDEVLVLAERMERAVRDRFLGHLLDQLRRWEEAPVAEAIERTLRESLLERELPA